MGHELAVGDKAADCRVWVRVWVRQLTHILARTVFGVFVTKKHRKPKFSMLFVVCRQKRCTLFAFTSTSSLKICLHYATNIR